MKIALIGCGFIGQSIAGAILGGVVDASLEVVFDAEIENAEQIHAVDGSVRIAGSAEEIIRSDADLVIEAASVDALKHYAVGILRSEKSLIAMSVGALADREFLGEIEDAAKENNVKVYLPSGAVGGLDALKSASVAELYDVSLVTTKPPKSLRGNPYLESRGIDVDQITEKQVVYEGSAAESIEKFPLNVNVAVAVGLCGLGPEHTRVTIVCDPEVERNTHEVCVKGDFGEFTFTAKNLPSPKNPRTSYLAALSAIATLKRVTSHIEIGT